MSKPKKLGNVWSVGAQVQVIDGESWKTVGKSMYTPRAINETLKSLGLKSAWIKWACGREFWTAGREIAHR